MLKIYGDEGLDVTGPLLLDMQIEAAALQRCTNAASITDFYQRSLELISKTYGKNTLRATQAATPDVNAAFKKAMEGLIAEYDTAHECHSNYEGYKCFCDEKPSP